MPLPGEGRDEQQRLRQNQKSGVKRSRWYRTYRERIATGRERCRKCGITSVELRFAHIIPHSKGGRYTKDNITIMCEPCDLVQGADRVRGIRPLSRERQSF